MRRLTLRPTASPIRRNGTSVGMAGGSLADLNYARGSSASHPAPCVACHGVRSHVVAVALMGEWSMPLV